MNSLHHLAASRLLAATSLALFAAAASAQAPTPSAAPTVTVTATATTTVANDRLEAWLRTEAEDVSPASAASQVNAAIAKALASICREYACECPVICTPEELMGE